MARQAQHPNAETLTGMEQPLEFPQAMTSPFLAPHGEAMAVPPTLNFGGLLRQLRNQARLTQEELAEARGFPRGRSATWSGASAARRARTPPDCWPMR